MVLNLSDIYVILNVGDKMQEEIWKDIEGYEGYQVSNLGRVRTYNKITYAKKHGKRHWKNKILKLKFHKKHKSYRVDLWKEGKHKTILVHRLVAHAFIAPNMNTNLTVNHKNGNRMDNRAENLEWCSLKENINHSFNTGLHKNQFFIKLTNKKNNETILCRSMNEASLSINKNHGYISSKIKNNIYYDDNYKWEIIN